MVRLRLRSTCALLALGLLIIWLRSRWVVLTPRRTWGPSSSDVVLGPLPFEVEWRVAAHVPAVSPVAFTLKKSTDSAQRQCLAKEGIELEVRQPV